MKHVPVLVLLVAVACGGPKASAPEPTPGPAPAPTRPADPSCAEGQSFFAHGCGGGPQFENGCYARCQGGAGCAAGFSCTKVTINPCHGSVCAACGAEAELCLPAAAPPS